MRIDYPTRSQFLTLCESAIRQNKDALFAGTPIEVHLESRRGYDGEITVTIEATNTGSFWAEWESKDPTRFPARIRAAAWALFRQRCFGTFDVSHESGIVTIRYISAPDRLTSRASVQFPSDSLPLSTELIAESARSVLTCKELHELFQPLRAFGKDYRPSHLPSGWAVYLFYENGEVWGHNGHRVLHRIVRVGISTRATGRFDSHYMPLDKLNADLNSSLPKDRSIFRKHIGRALLGMPQSPYSTYLEIWNKDLTTSQARKSLRHLRDIQTELAIETSITQGLEKSFRFRCFAVRDKEEAQELEGMIIGTLNRCDHCKASQDWLGRYHQDGRISQGKLWNIKKLNHIPLDTQWSLLLQDRVKKRLLEERQMGLPSGGSGSW